jgi:dolichol-phosphate mannosyltransferase
VLKSKEDFFRLIKFGMVGGSGIVVNTGVLWLLREFLNFPVSLASPVAIAVAVFNNFTWNNLFTWRERRDSFHSPYLHRLGKYYISTSLGALINYGILLLLTYSFEVNYLIANLTGIFAGMISNFILSEKWVFKSKTD